VEDLSTDDCRRYRVFCDLSHQVSDQYLGSGLGSCSSNESRYKWREALCQEEFDMFPPDKRRIKFKKTNWNKDQRKYNIQKIQQVRAEIDDVDNTVLKIAKKRAQIDATLTATNCSEFFRQDLEDMDEETRNQVEEQPPNYAPPRPVRQTAPLEPSKEPNRGHGKEGMKEPQAAPKEAKARNLQNWNGVIKRVRDYRTGQGTPYCVIDFDDGVEVVTITCFHQSLFNACNEAVGKAAGIRVFQQQNKKGDLKYWVLDSFHSIDGKLWGPEQTENPKTASADDQSAPAKSDDQEGLPF
jgi:hypothetical protein